MQTLKSTSVLSKEDSQFYEVRIFDKNGRLKRIISTKELLKRYWEKFELERLRTSLKTKNGGRVRDGNSTNERH